MEVTGELNRNTLAAEFASFVGAHSFPCLGAKAALNSGSYVLAVHERLGSEAGAALLAEELHRFTRSEMVRANEYATFVAAFREPHAVDEVEFERLLWLQLQLLHRIDATRAEWDPSVSSDPEDQHFSFSFNRQALYVVGLHPDSSRMARRFPWPTLIFNPNEQFERLRGMGKWSRMQAAIRARDLALQGSVNPMLSDFGERSEARQYSGRAVDESWTAPFRKEEHPSLNREAASRCPFAH